MARASFVRAAPDARRRDLIEATARCLAQGGVAGASVRAICREAGVSPGLLGHYFGGIEALIVATYRETGAQVTAAIDEAVTRAGPDPRARLEAYVTASFLPPVLDPALLATWLAFWSLVKSDPGVANAHAEIYRGYRAGLGFLVAECLGARAAAADVRLIAVGITALVDGLWLELCLDATTFTPGEARMMAVKWLDKLLA